MKSYETVIVFDSALDDERIGAKLQDVERRIRDGGGELQGTDRWGKRKLAYPMEKKDTGTYVVLSYRSDGSQIGEIDRVLRLDDTVLRHMTVVGPDEALVRKAAESAERAAQRRSRTRDEED